MEFNAWHYNEGNLVASLVDHLFRNLRVLPGSKDTELEERRASWCWSDQRRQDRRADAATVIENTNAEVERPRPGPPRARGREVGAYGRHCEGEGAGDEQSPGQRCGPGSRHRYSGSDANTSMPDADVMAGRVAAVQSFAWRVQIATTVGDFERR